MLTYKKGTIAGTEGDLFDLAETVYEYGGESSQWRAIVTFREGIVKQPGTPQWRKNGQRRMSKKRFRMNPGPPSLMLVLAVAATNARNKNGGWVS